MWGNDHCNAKQSLYGQQSVNLAANKNIEAGIQYCELLFASEVAIYASKRCPMEQQHHDTSVPEIEGLKVRTTELSGNISALGHIRLVGAGPGE
jgi:hypothetical protein